MVTRWKLAMACTMLNAAAAQAGPYSDDLSKGLVESTTREDRIALVRWMFAAAAAHPAVAAIASVSPAELDNDNKAVGTLFMKLLTDSCKDTAKKALSYEGQVTLQTSFQVLGQVAAAELFSSPEVAQAMSGLKSYVDEKKVQELIKAAATPQ